MVRLSELKTQIVTALAVMLLSGCGMNAYPTYGPNGELLDPYGTGAYGSYGSTYGSTYTDPYSSSTSYGSSYGSTYTDPYSSSTSYGSSYGSTYSDPYGTGTTGTYPTATPTPTPPPPTQVSIDQATLSAYVKDAKQTGLLGLFGVTAHVEISNPTNRTLTGKLRVVFTDDGNPSGSMQTRRVTLKPLETQVLTFSAKGYGINDAEATIETDGPPVTQSTVSDRN